jgi:hypothetical protein
VKQIMRKNQRSAMQIIAIFNAAGRTKGVPNGIVPVPIIASRPQ